MKFLTILSFIFIFSLITLAQTKTLQGEWSFLTLKENGENIILSESSKNQSIRFNKDGKLFASITCNILMGNYSLSKPKKIKISSLGITLKGCLEKEAKIEYSFGNVLKKITKYQIIGSVLTLKDERGNNVVILTKTQPKQNIPSDWEEFKECGFTFLAPSTIKDLKSKQIDSCIADFENKNLQISIVSGNYGESLRKMDSMTEYKEESIKIDGKKTQSVTYISDFMDTKNKMQRIYVAGIYVSVVTSVNGDDTITSLVMTITGKTKKDLETAKQIFNTIKFK